LFTASHEDGLGQDWVDIVLVREETSYEDLFDLHLSFKSDLGEDVI
jgi:hypothetical protein